MKITDLKPNQAIHCKTKQEAIDIGDLVRRVDEKWRTDWLGDSPDTCWVKRGDNDFGATSKAMIEIIDIYTEILPASLFLEEEFPKKWKIKIDYENIQILNKWRKEVKKSDRTLLQIGDDVYSEINGILGFSFDKDVVPGYTDITTEQFKTHVLKQTNMKDQYLTRKQLIRLRPKAACGLWSESIGRYLQSAVYESDDYRILINQSDIELAANECTPEQKKWLQEEGLILEEDKSIDLRGIFNGNTYFEVDKIHPEFAGKAIRFNSDKYHWELKNHLGDFLLIPTKKS